MATVALFCLSRSLSHAARTLTVARWLEEAGHRCVLHGAPGWLGRLIGESDKLTAHEEPELDDVLAASRGKRSRVDPALQLRLSLAADQAALRACGAELVVVDNRRSAGLAAESLGLPWISLTGGLLLGPHSAVGPRADRFAAVVGPVMGVPGDHMRRTGRLLQLSDDAPVRPQAQALGDALQQVLHGVGARPRRFVHELALGDRSLVLDHPALLPTEELPEGCVQVGPVLPSIGARPELPTGTGPRAWLTAGSTGDEGLLPGLARGLRRWGVEVVTTAGSPVEGTVSLPLTELDDLLPTVDLVVCHGGAGTVHHALAHGCRVLALPTHLEQAMVALALEARGWGQAMAAMSAQLEPVAATAAASALLRRPPPPPLHCPQDDVKTSILDAAQALC